VRVKEESSVQKRTGIRGVSKKEEIPDEFETRRLLIEKKYE
jgi:hypothetical protein